MGQRVNKIGKKKKNKKNKKVILKQGTSSNKVVKTATSKAVTVEEKPKTDFFGFSNQFFIQDLKQTAFATSVVTIILLIIFFMIK